MTTNDSEISTNDSEFPINRLVWRVDDEDAAVLWLSPRTRAGLADTWRELKEHPERKTLTRQELYQLFGERLLAVLSGSICLPLDHDA